MRAFRHVCTLPSSALVLSIVGLAMSPALPVGAQTGPRPANPAPRVEVIAEYPAGNFLENLDRLPNGDVVFTSYFAKSIEIIDKTGKARTFASLSAHPVSILALDAGFIVSAHGQPFTSGPGFVETQRFLLLDASGKETASFAVPQAKFLNGMVRHTNGTVLIADSLAGVIWQVDPKARTASPWLKHEALTQDPLVKVFKPGANGLKRRGQQLLISNSSRGSLSTIAIDAKGAAAGPLRALAKVDGIDDFAVARNGDIIFATHSDALRRLTRDGKVSDIISTGCDGCTAVAVVEGGSQYILVLTTGGFAEGRKDPARVLRVPYR